MRARRFNRNVRSLFGAVLVLGVALALAGPADAQTGDPEIESRTGKLHDDSHQFSTQRSGNRFELWAYCRTNDETDKTVHASVDLAADIGADREGRLFWDGSRFHELCENISVSEVADSVKLEAVCYSGCLMDSQGNRTCTGPGNSTDMDLSSRYRVTPVGAIKVK